MMQAWGDLTTEEFRTLDPERTVALLPVAAFEQHGPHLTVAVDTDINAGVVAAAAAFVDAATPVLVLPAMPVGKSNEHLAFPGTLSLSAETLIRLWTEIGESVVRAGVRKLVVFNSHGGQVQIVDVVVRDLRVRFGILGVAANINGLGMPKGAFEADELRHGIHGGAVETSMMLHLRPDHVRPEKVADFPSIGPQVAAENSVLRLLGPIGIGWMAQDVNPAGAVGDARAADAERGAQCVDLMARNLATLLGEVSRYPLARLRTGT